MNEHVERYEVEVPDTLDLAERAKLALNGLLGVFDRTTGAREPYYTIHLQHKPPFLDHREDFRCEDDGKLLESFPQMRTMCGDIRDLDFEREVMKEHVGDIAEDGLHYSVKRKERPWFEQHGHRYPRCGEDWTNVYGNARMMLAMVAWYQRDRDNKWLDLIGNMAEGLDKIAIRKENYAYYPDGKTVSSFSRCKSGWKNTAEPESETDTAEGSMMNYHGGQIRALARWYMMSRDQKALELAHRLVNFIIKRKFWGSRHDREIGIDGYERGHWAGRHFHGICVGLRGMLEYAIVTKDRHIKEFVRNSYEYGRNFGIADIGMFGEGCATADMIALAIKLSDAGVGDYWEDVDKYVRNHLVELQLVDIGLLKNVSEASSGNEIMSVFAIKGDKVIERVQGVFATGGISTLDVSFDDYCCTGNLMNALYYAWEGIVRCRDRVAQVNLLLNRASPWLDIDSYLPYEGKVVIKNKTPQKISVRIPMWVNREAVKSKVNDKEAHPFWVGNYMVFEKLDNKEVVTIEFPMVEERVKHTLPAGWDDHPQPVEYNCHFKGNTMVDITPRDQRIGYPIYQREHYKKDKAPMKKVTRYISPTTPKW